MRTYAIVIVTLLGMQLARPALAQTSGWDFSGQTPVLKDTAAPKAIATSVAKKTAALTETAVAKKTTASNGWDFSGAPSAVAVKAPAGPPASSTHAATPAASHGAPALQVQSGGVTDSKAVTVRVRRSEPVAVSVGATPVVPVEPEVLVSTRSAREHAIDVTATPLASVPASPEVGPITAAAAPTAAAVTAASTAAPAAPAPISTPPAVAQATKPVEPRKPLPTGLERLSDDWPKALKVGVQYRGRVEEPHGLASTKAGTDDAYYLNRLRLDATVVATPWLRVVGQVQDSQVLNYAGAAPTGMANTLDLRYGYVALERGSLGPFLRAGRQDLGFGAARLVGTADWGNTNRAFDGVRLGWADPRIRVEWFSAVPVVIVQGGFDTHSPTERVHGLVVGLPRIVPKGAIESYALIKTVDGVTSELGVKGHADIYTVGSRGTGKLPGRVDYALEAAVQSGARAGDRVAAVAGSYVVGWNVRASRTRPRLTLEFDHASGDDNAKDGSIGTFDQLYPVNHGKYGLADQIGWRNMRDLRAGFEVMPTSKLKVNTDVSRLSLATLGDAFYASSGAIRIFNPKATSRSIGTEVDVLGTYVISKELSIGAGMAALVTGDYLKQSTGGGTLWAPYVMWNVKF